MKIETDRRKKEEDEFVIKNLITIRSNSYKIKNSVNRLYKNAEIQRVKLEEKKKEIKIEREFTETNEYYHTIEYKKNKKYYQFYNEKIGKSNLESSIFSTDNINIKNNIQPKYSKKLILK